MANSAAAAAPLPVDPNSPDSVNIQKRVIIKSDTVDEDNNFLQHSDCIELDLDDDEKHLFASIRDAASAWGEGRLVFSADRSSGGESTSTTTKPAGGTEIPVIPSPSKKVQVRVAGGWVRDKILGLQTHDVDVALDTCTGVEFAVVLKTFVETIENQKQQQQQQVSSSQTSLTTENGDDENSTEIMKKKNTNNKNKNRCGRIGVIAANPDQSKHLETATMKIFGIEVDFSNLRHETYADDSRIPDTVMGTPLEDAYRRDFTMNSLFYNLHTQCIEDWTRRGLSDLLETKIVQTPLESYQTFHDDPLRVLRAIRFAVRYDMDLSPDLRSACMHPQIHKELHRKVSRERVGKELEGMLSGKHSNPQKAIDLICQMKLGGSVFCIPSSSTMSLLGTIGQTQLEQVPYRPTGDINLTRLREIAWEEAHECIKVLPQALNALESVRTFVGNEGDATTSIPSSSSTPSTTTTVDGRLVYLSTVLLPFEHLQYMEKNKPKTVAEYMVKEGIKFKTKDITSVVSLVNALDDMVQLLQCLPESTPATRLQVGMILRATKHMWVTTLVVATVSLLRKQQQKDKRHSGSTKRDTTNDMDIDDTPSPSSTAMTSSTESPDHPTTANVIDWCQRAQDWYRMISCTMQLDGCWTMKPLMNGKDIISAFQLEKGPEVGIYTQEQIRWMLMNHPNGTLDDLKQHLKTFQQAREREENQAAQHISKKMHL